jgi:hypothetical protein
VRLPGASGPTPEQHAASVAAAARGRLPAPTPAEHHARAVRLLREAARALDDDDDDVAPYEVRERILRFLTTTKEAT